MPHLCCVTIETSMSSATTPDPAPQSGPRLKRALGLWDLVFYGIILIQPTAPMPPFGVVSQVAHGHVVTTVLIAMVAMLFTAISYGRMARAYPSAGSAYTYVGREINSSLGFVTGWSLAMDYILNPIICTIWCSKAALNLVPEIPYAVWAVFFAVLFTLLNLRGIRATARTNEVLVLAMCVVVVVLLRRGRALHHASARGLLHAAVLRSEHFQPGPDFHRHFGRGAHLHRFRRHLHALRRSAQPAAQYPAGHRAHVPDHRGAGVRRGLRRTTDLAQLPQLSGCGHGLLLRGRARRWTTAFPCREHDPAGGHHRLRAWDRNSAPPACSTGWGATTPFRAASSARSSPSTAFPATTCCSWACWRWPERSP